MKIIVVKKLAALLISLYGSLFASSVKAAIVTPHVNIGVLGSFLSESKDLGLALFTAAKGKAPLETDVTGTGEITFIEYDAKEAHFAQVLFQNAEPTDFGQFFQALQSLDGAVFSLPQGIAPNNLLINQCLSVKAAGVPTVIVYFWSDTPTTSNFSSEYLSLFKKCGYSGSNIRAVHGKAKKQTDNKVSFFDVSELLQSLVKDLKPRVHNPLIAFAMPIDDVFAISGRGTIATGRVASGEIAVGNTLKLIGLDKEIKTSVQDIDMFRRKLTLARTGDHVGITLQGVNRSDVMRGMMLTRPNIGRQARNLSVKIDIWEGGMAISTRTAKQVHDYTFFMGTMSQQVKVKVLTEKSAIIEALEPIPIIPGWSFILRRAGKMITIGTLE